MILGWWTARVCAMITEVACTELDIVLQQALPAAAAAKVDVRRAEVSITYAWTVCRAAIFVCVRNGAVTAFIPFANTSFQNVWAQQLHPPGQVQAILSSTRGIPKDRALIRDPRRWWCNAGILCTTESTKPEGAWSATYLGAVLDMIRAGAARDKTLNCAFILNKRDHALHRPASDGELLVPYGFLYYPSSPPVVPDEELQWRVRACGGLLQFMSFYGDPSVFSDRLVPTTDDWETVMQGRLSHAASRTSAPGREGRAALRRKGGVLWKDKLRKAVFRGGSTGWGHSPVTNTRLALALRARMDDPEEELLDVRITGRNARHKVAPGGLVLSAQHSSVAKWNWLVDGKAAFMDAREQAKYRYHLYVDGHAGASRLGTLCCSGGVLIMVRNVLEEAMEVGHTWLHAALARHTFPFSRSAAEQWPEPHQFVISVPVWDVIPCVTWLNAHPDTQTLASRLSLWAESHVSESAILNHWHQVLTDAAKA